MKRLFLLLPLFFILSNSNYLNAQVFGNTIYTGYGGYGQNQIVWIKFTTSASDSGVFTDFGVYDHPTTGATCDYKFALYSDHATIDRPENLLVSEYVPSPVNGQWNQYPISPTLTIDPSTTYWISLRFNCQYGSGREVGVNWAEPPLKYYGSYSFFSAHPDPVNASSLSTQGFLNNVALYVVGNNAVVPVELISFDLKKDVRNAILNWSTGSELNNKGWNIQYSNNGFTWNTIDWVEGNGNSSEELSYEYTDPLRKEGLSFYRLEQVDYDGQRAYSDVRIVDHILSDITISPNPVNDYLFIKGLKNETTYQLYDAQGAYLLEATISPNESIDFSMLQSGIYFLKINDQHHRIIKQ